MYSGIAGPNNNDESEQAWGKRQGTVKTWLQGKSESRAGDQNAEWEGWPPSHESTAETPRNPADSDWDDEWYNEWNIA